MSDFRGNRVPAPLLGELCLQHRKVPPRSFKECHRLQILASCKGVRRRLGEIFIEKGCLDRHTLESVLEEQRRLGLFAYPEIPGYRLEERLGRGAMAQVYRATQLNVGRSVALKILNWKESHKKDDVARFFREARSAARLNHPNIVQAIEFGQVEETYFFVMELVEGFTLQHLLVLEGRVPEAQALEVARQVTEALCHLEAHQMVHRDLKPSNILLNGDLVKICDLGLARELAHGPQDWTVTHDGMILGTPQYLSPEQARGQKDLDIRTDLYSLGVMLYRMVSGELPFQAESPAAFIYKQINEPLKPPEELQPGLSLKTSRLIQTLMAKERYQRFRGAREALEEILACRAFLEESGRADAGAVGRPVAGAQEEGEQKTEPPVQTHRGPALLFSGGQQAGRRVDLTQDETVVGRQLDCDIQVVEPWFSRRHFVIRRENQQWVFEDLNSRNGTQINGLPAMSAVLRHRDEISVKDTRILFLLESVEGGS